MGNDDVGIYTMLLRVVHNLSFILPDTFLSEAQVIMLSRSILMLMRVRHKLVE